MKISNGITPYPYNDKNHKKNVKYWQDMTGNWLKEVYKMNDGELEHYKSTERCDVCAGYFHKDNQRCADVVNNKLYGVICQNCSTILNAAQDTEHLKQLLDYQKERGTHAKVQDTKLPKDNRRMSRSNQSTDTDAE